MEIRKVTVAGAGIMGSGISQVFAMKGFDVVMVDIKEEFLEKGMRTIKKSLGKFVEKGKLDQVAADEALGRIRTSVALKEGHWADLAIEAVTEDKSIKREVFKALDTCLKPDALLASNTTSISITELAASSGRAPRFIGMHFMSPVPQMQLVEVINGAATSKETTDRIVSLCEKLDKTPVVVEDYPGFVSSRLIITMINEAIYTLMEGVATKEGIDMVMKLGMNHPMGPLSLADYVGLDVVLAAMETLYKGFGDSKYRPCPLLVKMVKAGFLGKKSGRGFYEYT
ncbi:MAG: 3-hydroxyacyl-CoA dehydrogenase NAD-binding domain-containing protein [Candidatus Eremiobacteraeota bacterium]|nr:3-hydroxyacyl-CoA dehydrogenase NAD-binding domain-containing protein [Candidatus Eremiobacteraeota bacterium]